MLVSRVGRGLVLLARLGPQYLAAAWLARLWRAPARAWRRRIDATGARLLSAHIRHHGGLLIKIGQFVASRPDIFPLTYVDACAPLRDQAPARPFATITAALDDAYEGRTPSHLARIEETPLASASFGQVHRAWLADGRLVAVKIQHRDLATTVAADLWVVRLALRLFALVLKGWPLQQIYEVIERTSRDEQDYLHEGSAADRLRPGLAKHGLRVPEVLWEHTREKVLVMEFAAGTTLAQLDVSALSLDERRRIADVLIDGFLHMLLDEGFFHADPHAGNLVYDPPTDGRPATLWLIDFGMTAIITRRESELYRRFLDHLRRNDTDGMVDVLTDLGWVLPSADRTHLKALAREVYESLAHLDPQSFKGSRRETELGAKILEFLRRMEGIVFPQHTILLSRSTGLVEGVCMTLVPGKNLLDLIRPRLGRIGSWRTRLRLLREEFTALWRDYRSLPERIEAGFSRRQDFPLAPLLLALLLIAALQLEPGPARTWAAVASAGGLGWWLLRRGAN